MRKSEGLKRLLESEVTGLLHKILNNFDTNLPNYCRYIFFKDVVNFALVV